jgi:hypothetical protein
MVDRVPDGGAVTHHFEFAYGQLVSISEGRARRCRPPGARVPGSRNRAFALAPMPYRLEPAIFSQEHQPHQIGRTRCERVTSSAARPP